MAIEAMGMNEIFHEEEIIQEAKTSKFPKYQDKIFVNIKMTQSLKEYINTERKEDIIAVAAEDTVSKRGS